MALLDLQEMDPHAAQTGYWHSQVSVLMCPSDASIELCWRSELSMVLCG